MVLTFLLLILPMHIHYFNDLLLKASIRKNFADIKSFKLYTHPIKTRHVKKAAQIPQSKMTKAREYTVKSS